MELKSKIENDKFTQYLYDKYDIQDKEFTKTLIPDFPVEELAEVDWDVLAIIGPSGSGKSHILEQLDCTEIEHWDDSKSIISQFPDMEPADVCNLYFAVGLNSIPALFRKPGQLSNGEFARFVIAWNIKHSKDIIYVDEFTSTVNRATAKSICWALQRYIRNNKKKLIVASCHYDIIDWLRPDLVFNLLKQENNKVELENLIYNDNEQYNLYVQLNKDVVLTDRYVLPD